MRRGHTMAEELASGWDEKMETLESKVLGSFFGMFPYAPPSPIGEVGFEMEQ